jgi:hypothetical protein
MLKGKVEFRVEKGVEKGVDFKCLKSLFFVYIIKVSEVC